MRTLQLQPMPDTPHPDGTLASAGAAAGLVGHTIDKYELLEKVGEGGMATVYRARHRTLDREVALKMMHPMLASTPSHRERFFREARTWESLRNSNIPRIFDFSGVEDESCYIVSEFVRGETLAKMLDRVGQVPSEFTAMIAARLCEALACAHESMVVHRDVKPENIMVTPDGRVLLMDFGIARLLDETSMTMTGALVGSPAYMSPEQASEQRVDHRSDLFSLGTVLFHCIAGRPPFVGTNTSVVLRKIVDGERPELRDLVPDGNPHIVSIIERLLTIDAEDRPSSAEAVRDELEGALAEVGLLPEPPSGMSLADFVCDPEEARHTLEKHLVGYLTDKGRAALSEGRKSTALACFDRVLCLDESNTEVVELLQQAVTREDPPAWRRRLPWLIPVAVPLLVLAVFLIGRSPDDRRDDIAPPEGFPQSARPLEPAGESKSTGEKPDAPAVDKADGDPAEPDPNRGDRGKPASERRPVAIVPAPLPDRRTPPDEPEPTPVPIDPDAPPAILKWASRLPFEIEIDGGPRREIYGADIPSFELSPGEHRVCAYHQRDASEPICKTYLVRGGEPLRHIITAKDVTWKPLRIRVSAEPGTVVEVDGQERGVCPLDAPIEVDGQVEHTVRLTAPDGVSRKYIVPADNPGPGGTFPIEQ